MIDNAVGIPSNETLPALQSNAWVELVNKIAWALGSTYRVPYNRPRGEPRRTAIALAHEVLASHGYPSYLKK